MKFSKYKLVTLFLALGTFINVHGQKHDKKYNETFNVNKDVVVDINASNTEIEVTTWNKNQVLVQAVISVEGLTKEEADKYLKNYSFDAMGNSKRVVIKSKGNNFYGLNDNFVIFNDQDFNFPDIVIPEMDFDFRFPDMETIVIPDINFDALFNGLDDLEFDFERYSKDGKNYFFQWKDSARNISIKSKKEWEKFKKSKEYKEWKADMKKNAEKIRKDFAKARKDMKNVNKDAIAKALKEAQIAIKKIDKEKINKEIKEAMKKMGKVKGNYFFDTSGDVIINDKKVKITKKITIKVPKGATFDLNTRHCKIKLPTTTAYGKTSYGTFKAEGLVGGDLDIYYAPVTVKTVKNGKLSLHNVTDAVIASVANATLSSSSGKLEIDEVFSDVDLSSSFGDLSIRKLNSALSTFNLTLRQSDAKIGKSFFVNNLKSEDKDSYTGNFALETKKGGVSINGKYSSLALIK